MKDGSQFEKISVMTKIPIGQDKRGSHCALTKNSDSKEVNSHKLFCH